MEIIFIFNILTVHESILLAAIGVNLHMGRQPVWSANVILKSKIFSVDAISAPVVVGQSEFKQIPIFSSTWDAQWELKLFYTNSLTF